MKEWNFSVALIHQRGGDDNYAGFSFPEGHSSIFTDYGYQRHGVHCVKGAASIFQLKYQFNLALPHNYAF